MMNYDPLNAAIDSVAIKLPPSFGDIREAALEKFGRGWKSEFARESGLSLRQIERWDKFARGESGQTRNPDTARGATREKIVQFGERLDLSKKDAPRGGIDVKIWFNDPTGGRSSRKEERVTPTLHLSHSEAVQWLAQKQPDYTTLFNLWGERMIGSSLFGEEGAYPADIVDVVAS